MAGEGGLRGSERTGDPPGEGLLEGEPLAALALGPLLRSAQDKIAPPSARVEPEDGRRTITRAVGRRPTGLELRSHLLELVERTVEGRPGVALLAPSPQAVLLGQRECLVHRSGSVAAPWRPNEGAWGTIGAMASAYDDELWRLVPDERVHAPTHLRRFVRDLGPAGHALDLGCGDGRLAVELAAERLVAADVSAVALARAETRLVGRPADFVELEPDAPLPLHDSAFDLVLCAETLEHVRDIQLMLSEARRVLRPGGRLAVATPAHWRLTGLDVLARGFEARFDPLSPHLRYFTRRSLRRLLAGMGFRVEELRRRQGSLLAVARR